LLKYREFKNKKERGVGLALGRHRSFEIFCSYW